MINKQQNISIIIPAYNRAKIIPATLDSILAQTYQNWECIVVDDLSKDDTKAVVQQYVEKDCRFRLLTNERKKGAQGARNTGILHAHSEWVICFDSDDTMRPQYLERMVAAIDDESDVIACWVDEHFVDLDTSEIAKWAGNGWVETDLMAGKLYVNFDNAMFRKSALEDIGLLDEDCPSYQEYDTHLRVSREHRYKAVEDILVDYYLGNPDSISSSKKNSIGRSYVLWKNQKRWREVSYRSYYNNARHLFVGADRFWKKRLLCMAPEILPAVCIAYMKKWILNLIKRK